MQQSSPHGIETAADGVVSGVQMPLRTPLPAPALADLLGRLSTALGAGIDLRRAWASETARAPMRWRPAMEAVAAGRPIDLVGSGLTGPTGLMWYLAMLIAAIAGMAGGVRIAGASWRAGGIVRRVVALVPVVGPAARAAEAAAWCRAASLASGAGLSAGRLVQLTALVAPGLALDPHEFEETLRTGATLADALHATGRFPRVVVEAVDVGELTGTTAETLDRLAGDLDDEARRGIAAAARGVGFLVWAAVAALIALVVLRIFSSYLGMIQDAARGI